MKRLVIFMFLLCLIAIAGTVFAEEPKPAAPRSHLLLRRLLHRQLYHLR